MNENEKTQFIKDLKEFLHDGVVNVCFEKKDGTERIMNCTLASEFIPEDMTPKGLSVKARSKDVLAVFDTDNNGWRSFLLENVKYIKTL